MDAVDGGKANHCSITKIIKVSYIDQVDFKTLTFSDPRFTSQEVNILVLVISLFIPPEDDEHISYWWRYAAVFPEP